MNNIQLQLFYYWSVELIVNHKHPKFTFIKGGYYYFTRRIPCDLLEYYRSKKICYSLKTKSIKVATKRALIASVQLDGYWSSLRLRDNRMPFQHLAFSDPMRRSITKPESVDLGPKLSEALAIYLKLKGRNRPKTYAAAAERACRYLTEKCGDKHLLEYTKADATGFRDALLYRGLNGSSISRLFGTIKTIITFAANETGVSLVNPFIGVYFDKKEGINVRQPIPPNHIKTIQRACYDLDDEMRRLVGMVADTGMRIAEAAGLLITDIHLNEEIPFVRIQPHSWRRLKTVGSARDVPLHGSSLWSARRIVETAEIGKFAFERYNSTDTTNANSASAALNKWLKRCVEGKYTIHGFRHAMRDRLRNVECPTEIADQIGGWSSSSSIGQSYGSGYGLEITSRWLGKAVALTMSSTLQ